MVSAAVTLYPLRCPVLADKLYPVPFAISAFLSLPLPFLFIFTLRTSCLRFVCLSVCLSLSLSPSLSLSLFCFFSRCRISLQAARSMPGRVNSIKRSARNALSAASKNPRRYTCPDRRICIRASDYIARYRYTSRANYAPFVGKRIDRFKLRLSSRISRVRPLTVAFHRRAPSLFPSLPSLPQWKKRKKKRKKQKKAPPENYTFQSLFFVRSFIAFLIRASSSGIRPFALPRSPSRLVHSFILRLFPEPFFSFRPASTTRINECIPLRLRFVTLCSE